MRKYEKRNRRWKILFQIPGFSAFPFIKRSFDRILKPYQVLFVYPFTLRDKYFKKFAKKSQTFIGLESSFKSLLYYDHIIASAARCPFSGSHIDACDSYPWQWNKRLFGCTPIVRDLGFESEMLAEILEIVSFQDLGHRLCREINELVYFLLDRVYFGVKNFRNYLIESIVDEDSEIDSIIDKVFTL